jgi:hypothetical protein
MRDEAAVDEDGLMVAEDGPLANMVTHERAHLQGKPSGIIERRRCCSARRIRWRGHRVTAPARSAGRQLAAKVRTSISRD